MIDPLLALTDAGELAADIRRLFTELERSALEDPIGECSPPIDVTETAEAYTIRADVPGVTRDAVRVFFKCDAIIVVGRKPALAAPARGMVHRLERECGRFARTIRVPSAVDGARISATLRRGELIVIVPKIQDRRAQAIRVAID